MFNYQKLYISNLYLNYIICTTKQNWKSYFKEMFSNRHMKSVLFIMKFVYIISSEKNV